MGPTEISGLPAHVLLVHLVIAAVPVAAIVVVVVGVWPPARRRLTWLTPLIALLALALVPVTTHAGEWLLARVEPTPLIQHHIALGKQLLPWAAALFGVAILVWVLGWLEHRAASSAHTTSPIQSAGTLLAARVVVGVLAIGIGVGAVQQVVRTGEAGSRAVWQGNFATHAGQ